MGGRVIVVSSGGGEWKAPRRLEDQGIPSVITVTWPAPSEDTFAIGLNQIEVSTASFDNFEGPSKIRSMPASPGEERALKKALQKKRLGLKLAAERAKWRR